MKLPPHLAHITLKDLLSPPFIACPQCGKEALGVMTIGNHQCSRRCYMCGVIQRYALPKLSKKVIYLDQFVISNIAKQLDPDVTNSKRGSHAEFFMELFQMLDKLCKLQLLVCPESPIHQHESIVTGSHFDNLREVYRHLSYEVRFKSPDRILNCQILTAYQAWFEKATPLFPGERSTALDGDLEDWTDRLRIEVNSMLPGLAAELESNRLMRTNHLHGVCKQWQSAHDFSFKAVVEREMRALGESIIQIYLRHLTKIEMASRGELPISEVAFFPPEMLLMTRLMTLSESTETSFQGQMGLIQTFFNSKIFRKVPYVKVWSLFWGTLARVVRSGMNPANYPSGSIYNDLKVIAAYSPYCDAMFVDQEMDSLSRQGDLGKCLASGARIFSLRSKEAFLEYLRQLEKDASAEHIELVKEVYGPDAITPFIDLLKWDKRERNKTPIPSTEQ